MMSEFFNAIHLYVSLVSVILSNEVVLWCIVVVLTGKKHRLKVFVLKSFKEV